MIIFGLNIWEQASDLLLERDGGKKAQSWRDRMDKKIWNELERRKEFENILYVYSVYLKRTHSV